MLGYNQTPPEGGYAMTEGRMLRLVPGQRCEPFA
jgi:hypothetical protein